METLAIFSNTLRAAAEGDLITASQKYELRLAKGLSAFFTRVIIISPAVEQDVKIDGIYYVHADKKTKRVADFYRAGRDKKISHILFFGYHPMVIRQAVRFGPAVKKYAFIFDTHRGMCEYRSFLRRTEIQIVFHYGLHCLKRLNGLLLFKQAAYTDIGQKLPYLLTTIPAHPDNCTLQPRKDRGNAPFTVCYAGALTSYNSILEVAEAAKRFAENKEPVQFVICGSGPLYQALKQAAPENMTLTGRITENEVHQWIQRSDLMLNIRRTNDIINSYAYPSKLIDYLEQGKTVLTTDVNPQEPLSEVCFLLKNTDAGAIYEGIRAVMQAADEAAGKRQRIERYLHEYHNAKEIYSAIYAFLISTET